MHAWESVQKAVDYIENNIGEEIHLNELADIAHLSYFYFHRLFARLVKKPVQEYIKLRRLARACKSLADKNKRILDIALEYGFGSHETFTRAFKDAYRITPSEYRDNPVMLNSFHKPDLLLDYVMIDEGVPLVSDGLVLEMNRKTLYKPMDFLGIVGFVKKDSQVPLTPCAALSKKVVKTTPSHLLGQVTGIDEPGAIWERFELEAENKINRKPNGRGFGVSFIGDAPKGYFSYFAGVEVESGTRDTGFYFWRLPAREYVVCCFEVESNFTELVTSAIEKAMKYSMLWLKNHGLERDYFTTEHYYRSTADAAYMELWFAVKDI